MHYTPLAQNLFDELDDHALFQSFYEHIQKLLGNLWFPITNVENICDIPEPAKNIWYLWWFAAEVGGNGMSAWVANCVPHAPEIISSHHALSAVGATQLLELLEASFSPARDWDAEFLREPQAPWFNQFPPNLKFSSFEAIDPPCYQLAAEPLSAIVAAYMRDHRGEL